MLRGKTGKPFWLCSLGQMMDANLFLISSSSQNVHQNASLNYGPSFPLQTNIVSPRTVPTLKVKEKMFISSEIFDLFSELLYPARKKISSKKPGYKPALAGPATFNHVLGSKSVHCLIYSRFEFKVRYPIVIFRPHIMGEENFNLCCVFSQILPKLHFIATQLK